MTTNAIDVQGLTKVFNGKTVVDHVSLTVKRGTVFGFLGANGSGKTTMIRMICGLLSPTEGTGNCLGYDIKTQSADIKLKIGYMPQKFSLYHDLTVSENLQFFADIYKMQESKQAIENIIEELELEPYRHIKTGNLSGGWKQRLTLACCLLHKPDVLFLDEPTAGVDPKARKDFWSYLHKVAIRDGTTVLITTHYMDEAEKCTDLAYISLGKLLYSGPTKNLIPFSQVKAYQVTVAREDTNQLSELILHSYPGLLMLFANNEWRISSRNQVLLTEFFKDEKILQVKEVPPSFEEVFIGLMQ
ncbi:MAG: ABC transporter ATP-binding protein [Legionellales bacterium]|nr:ABC transporter ATP-binding protein [Legionellales bacterium]